MACLKAVGKEPKEERQVDDVVEGWDNHHPCPLLLEAYILCTDLSTDMVSEKAVEQGFYAYHEIKWARGRVSCG